MFKRLLIRRQLFLLSGAAGFLLMGCVAASYTPSTEQATSTNPLLETQIATLDRGIAFGTVTPTMPRIPIDLPTRYTFPTKQVTPTNLPLLPSHYDLPAWLLDPHAAILMAVNSDSPEEKYISFINLTAGQIFNLPAPPLFSGPKWGYDEAGLYFEYVLYEMRVDVSKFLYTERVHAANGKVDRIPIPEEDSPTIEQISNGRYRAQVGSAEPATTVTLEDTQTGQAVILVDPFQGRYLDEVQVAWSPKNDLLAVLRTKYPPGPYMPDTAGLTLYSTNGDVYRQYDEFRSPGWSPDLYWSPTENQILFVKGEDFGNRYPCLLDVVQNSTHCPDSVSSWRGTLQVVTDYYQWVPDGKSLSFIYWSTAKNLTGLCLLNLTTEAIVCPINEKVIGADNFVADYGWSPFLVDYDWSPDGNYLWLTVDGTDPLSDDRGEARLATIKKNGTRFQIWERYSLPQPWWVWRPNLAP